MRVKMSFDMDLLKNRRVQHAFYQLNNLSLLWLSWEYVRLTWMPRSLYSNAIIMEYYFLAKVKRKQLDLNFNNAISGQKHQVSWIICRSCKGLIYSCLHYDLMLLVHNYLPSFTKKFVIDAINQLQKMYWKTCSLVA